MSHEQSLTKFNKENFVSHTKSLFNDFDKGQQRTTKFFHLSQSFLCFLKLFQTLCNFLQLLQYLSKNFSFANLCRNRTCSILTKFSLSNAWIWLVDDGIFWVFPIMVSLFGSFRYIIVFFLLCILCMFEVFNVQFNKQPTVYNIVTTVFRLHYMHLTSMCVDNLIVQIEVSKL